ncbi:hypothetical protein B484DRAFT_456533 [Ochromonadaceae sp. CCMP2298]|nr:hypothetical protein B484DRAFT_456533 [Ochromonadaceae sp. CCMP2298]
MAALDLPGVLSQIETKMAAELDEGHPYEALQYVQSFIARKKKNLGGPVNTSAVVFHGAKTLISKDGSSSAGTLLKWFIENGAGADHSFKMYSGEKLKSPDYCDIQRTIDLIGAVSSAKAFPVVLGIYNPLHVMVAKSKVARSAEFIQRMEKFEALCAKIYEDSERWYSAFKCYVRLGLSRECARVLNSWSLKGHPSEKGLFFGRAVLHLLSEGKVPMANELLTLSKEFIVENEGGGADSAPMAVWHIASLLTELAALPPAPRVDKNKLYGILYKQYAPFLIQLDPKLLELLTKTGEVVFNYQPPSTGQPQQAPNPMAMLQGLLGGGGGGAAAGSRLPPPNGVDMDQMMTMMNRLQNRG